MAAPTPARVALLVALIALNGHMNARAASPAPPADRHYYLPSQAASKIVTVTRQGEAAAEIIVLTQPVAIKENGPKETINAFGEVYAFSPTFIAVHRDEPTQITFWNLQPDDDPRPCLLTRDGCKTTCLVWLTSQGPIPPRLLSVGDFWRNTAKVGMTCCQTRSLCVGSAPCWSGMRNPARACC